MHWLQQHILSQLIHHSSRRFADLKPADIESNLFMYHLRHLMRSGYLIKAGDGRYQLTTEGQRFVDTLSLKTLTPRAQPRIVTLVVCRNQAGEHLFLRRRRQPLLGMVGFPYGKIHLGETIAVAAARELREKAGLSAELAHRGDGYITIRQDGEPVSQIMFHLFYGENPVGQLQGQTSAGEAFWAPVSAIDPTFMPSVADLLQLLHVSQGRFFTELDYNLCSNVKKLT